MIFLTDYLPFLCGAGGSRTLVQTSRKNAFYKFSLRLLVGCRTVRDQPHDSLSSKFSLMYRSLHSLSVLFRHFYPDVGPINFWGSARG